VKYILVVGDGMADYPVPELGGKTPLQAAYKPNMDSIAAGGQSGLLKTVPDTMIPGSDTAICSLMGYDPVIYCTGRGPLEAPTRGIKLGANDAAYRCNLITEAEGAILDYSAGHITTEEASELIKAVEKAFGKKGKIEFYSGMGYRHFLIMRNFPHPELVACTLPHDAIGIKVSEVLPKAKEPKAEKDARLLRNLIDGSRDILRSHPVNVAREKSGKRPGNLIWPWGGGKKPSMPTLKEKFGLTGAVISAVDLVKGIGTYAGMEIIEVPGATGFFDTDYEGKAAAALKALREVDLVFVHVEAPDEAGHSKDFALKVKTIEDLDRRLLGGIIAGLDEPYAISISPDHPTPVGTGTHSREPVPFAIKSPGLKPDGVKKFDESSARNGAFGTIENDYLISLLVHSTDRVNKIRKSLNAAF
jgi:2,3-bisphosphoglycerate-independent phosphoglycerate mutase